MGSVQTILKEVLCLKRVQSYLVPKTLHFLEKENRRNVCETMLSDYQPVIKRIITGDELWIYSNFSKIKVILIVFFDYCGVVHYEFLSADQTASNQYYLGVIHRLRKAISKKRPDLWADNSWFLHHNNATYYSAFVIRDHFAKNSTNIVPQPLFSPDLAPCDFWLFSKLKILLRGHCFECIEEIERESLRALKDIPVEAFSECFEDWQKRWHKCILSNGDYLEGDEIDL